MRPCEIIGGIFCDDAVCVGASRCPRCEMVMLASWRKQYGLNKQYPVWDTTIVVKGFFYFYYNFIIFINVFFAFFLIIIFIS